MYSTVTPGVCFSNVRSPSSMFCFSSALPQAILVSFTVWPGAAGAAAAGALVGAAAAGALVGAAAGAAAAGLVGSAATGLGASVGLAGAGAGVAVGAVGGPWVAPQAASKPPAARNAAPRRTCRRL